MQRSEPTVQEIRLEAVRAAVRVLAGSDVNSTLVLWMAADIEQYVREGRCPSKVTNVSAVVRCMLWRGHPLHVRHAVIDLKGKTFGPGVVYRVWADDDEDVISPEAAREAGEAEQ